MTKKTKKKSDIKTKKENWLSSKPVLHIILKSLIIIIGFFIIIQYIDIKGFFNPDERNNHTKRKWDSYYEFTNKNNVDIVLVGNSHLYSGINPKNLSIALGCNAFILASPGTNIADSYYGLKEALTRTKAKLVIVETYGIKEFNPYELKGGPLSDQFKSFYARKDFLTKLTSTPFLFNADNYFYAWSNTIRNHDFIFKDTMQLTLNKKLIADEQKMNKANSKLYLGRFVRFQTGIESGVMDKYNSIGAPVNGKDYAYNSYTINYVNKIKSLCKEEGVELVFLTLPMYEKHISNYDEWEKKMSEIIGSYRWIDMQKSTGYKGFGPFAFENTYNENQHMTYSGSLLATYKLVEYLRDSLQVKLPKRSEDYEWHKMFYGEEGYFENYIPEMNDKNNTVICDNKILQNVTLKQVLHVDKNNKKANKIIAKINKKMLGNINYNETNLRLILNYEIEDKRNVAILNLVYDQFHSPKDEVIYMSMIMPIQKIDIVDGMLIKD